MSEAPSADGVDQDHVHELTTGASSADSFSSKTSTLAPASLVLDDLDVAGVVGDLRQHVGDRRRLGPRSAARCAPGWPAWEATTGRT